MGILPDKKGLSANVIKYIAIVAMLIDHIGWAFVPFNSIVGQVMHLIGRLTAPIMCFFIAEGYYHTKNVKKYMLRLGIFAIISHFPFLIADIIQNAPFLITDGKLWINPELLNPSTSVFFTLFLGLVALNAWNTSNPGAGRVFTVIGLCLISMFGDWMCFSVLWILFFGIYRGNFKKQIISFYIIALAEMLMIAGLRLLNGNFSPFIMIWQLGLLLPPIILYLYNGKRGSANPFHKWFFYIFYPLHLLVIGLFKFYI